MTLRNHIGLFYNSIKLLLLLVFTISPCTPTYAQDTYDEIGAALKAGNSKQLGKYFDLEVDLTFSDKTNYYSKKQAIIILDRFFSKENPQMYQWLQQGSSKTSNTKFSIGRLTTAYNVYKVYVFFVYKNSKYYIRELRFEK